MAQRIEPAAADEERPLLRRIVDFPLIAMITAVLILLVATQIAGMIGQRLPPMTPELRITAQAGIAIALLLVIYKVAIRHLGEIRRDDLPFTKRAAIELGAGLLLGAVLFTLVVGTAAALDVYNIVGEGGTAQLVAILVSASIVPAFIEELLFRGVLFRWIEEFAGSWAALILTSALFGGAHLMNPNATPFASFAIALEAGLLLGGAYMLTRSLWLPIGLHAAWNFTQGFVWDVPVSGIDQEGLVDARLSGPELLSGGAFGLEASVIAMAIATAAGLWLVARAVRAGQVMQPWWVRRRRADGGDRPNCP